MISIKHVLAHMLALSLLMTSIDATIAEDAPPDLKSVRDSFADRKTKLDELSVTWRLNHSYNMDVNSVCELEKADWFYQVDTIAAFKGPKRFYDQRYSNNTSRRPVSEEAVDRMVAAFDGSTTRIFEHKLTPKGKKRNHEARVWPGDEIKQFSAADHFMSYHGLNKTSFSIWIDGSRFLPCDLLEEMNLPGCRVEPTAQAAVDGTSCVVLDLPHERVWLDPRLGLAIRQRDWKGEAGRPIATRVRFEDHSEVLPGIWLGRRIIQDYFADPSLKPGWTTRPYHTEVMTVAKLETSVPDETFRFEIPPTTYVNDMSRLPALPDGSRPVVAYAIPASPTNLDEVVREATNERSMAAESHESNNIVKYLFYINISVVLLYALYLIAARYRTGKTFKGRSVS